jgi:predicted XRE-type DNA-binding protein
MPRTVKSNTNPAPDDISVEPSSGNVFADLGFEQPELEMAKAHLSHKIALEITARKLTQRAAADVLGIDQPRVSLLIRGKTGQFSLEKLIEFLERLSYDVHIEATRSANAARGQVIVSV